MTRPGLVFENGNTIAMVRILSSGVGAHTSAPCVSDIEEGVCMQRQTESCSAERPSRDSTAYATGGGKERWQQQAAACTEITRDASQQGQQSPVCEKTNRLDEETTTYAYAKLQRNSAGLCTSKVQFPCSVRTTMIMIHHHATHEMIVVSVDMYGTRKKRPHDLGRWFWFSCCRAYDAGQQTRYTSSSVPQLPRLNTVSPARRNCLPSPSEGCHSELCLLESFQRDHKLHLSALCPRSAVIMLPHDVGVTGPAAVARHRQRRWPRSRDNDSEDEDPLSLRAPGQAPQPRAKVRGPHLYVPAPLSPRVSFEGLEQISSQRRGAQNYTILWRLLAVHAPPCPWCCRCLLVWPRTALLGTDSMERNWIRDQRAERGRSGVR